MQKTKQNGQDQGCTEAGLGTLTFCYLLSDFKIMCMNFSTIKIKQKKSFY